MNTHEPSGTPESFEALAAADPVLGQSEDAARLGQIRERVLARTRAEDAAGITVDRRFRTRKLAWAGGAAAACALVVAGGLGGAAISAGGSDGAGGGQIVAAGSPMMPTMGNGAGSAGRESGALAGDLVSQVGGRAGAPGYAADAKVSSGASMPYVGYYGWRTILEAGPGITDEPGSAPGYLYTMDDTDTQQVAAAVAAAFGVSGDPVSQGGDGMSWMVGSMDGSGPQVWVGGWGSMVNWSYNDSSAYVACDMPTPETKPTEDDAAAGSSASGSGVSSGEPSPVCAEAGTPPTEKESIARAKDALAATGVDPASVEWEVYRDDYNSSVTAWQLVGGQRTSMAWTFAFSQNGKIQWASGFAADLVEVPAYPIVGARTAIERMKDPRWSTMLSGGPMYAARDLAISGSAQSSDAQSGASEPVMMDGRPVISIPVSTVVIDKAELGLTQYTQPDGNLVLIPAYLLTAADGSTWSVLAITEDYIDFSLPQG